ncbi:hypothetical protein [uncultured Tenacibaculum sp.]|uniref:hypothetical protein n=1 Tax=uncultured Tenacibaculum sp. TaxID=174713 RepID=UPI0026233E3E|nr:hypothetical protein [uncultured Tenacibaculum sp.]
MKLKLMIVLLLLLTSNFYGQKSVQQYEFKKGEVLDILLISNTKKDFNKLFDRYKKTIFPVGVKYSFTSQKGFKTGELILGSYLPKSLIFGKWENIVKREQFLNVIEKEVPDFHEQRRKLFTHFELAYYEIQNDIKFEIDRNKHNVVTSFWKKNKQDGKFIKGWVQEVKKSGGKIVVKLTNGKSPLGYYYNPALITIVTWETKQAFQSFLKQHPLSTYKDLKHVHQFVID